MTIKPHLEGYVRDSYIGKGESVRKKYNITSEHEIDCDLGTSPFGQSPKVKKAVQEFDFEEAVHYPKDPFHEGAKEVILDRFKDSNLKPENIFFGHGAFNLAERIVHKLIKSGTNMLGYGPQFNEIPTEMRIAGGEYNPIPMDLGSFLFPETEMLSALDNGGYSMVYIDNPNNPTGQLIHLSSLEKIIYNAKNKDTLVLIDEAYGDFVEDSESAFNLVDKHDNLIVIRSLSKGMGLGSYRFGYAAISSELARFYKEIDVPFEPSLICAVAGKAALEDSAFLHNIRIKSREAKTILTQGLSELGLRILPTHPNVSIFVANSKGEDLYEKFASQGIITEAGESYKLVFSEFDNSFVRIRVPKNKGNKPSDELSHEILDRLSKNG